MYKLLIRLTLFSVLTTTMSNAQLNLQSKYEHNFIHNKNNASLNHGNKYGIEGEYIFSNNLTLSLGFNYTLVNREFSRSSIDYVSGKVEAQEVFYKGRYQTLEFMTIGIGYEFRLNDKLFLVPKLRYSPYLRLKAETINASKTEMIYTESQNTGQDDPYISSTTMYENKIDPIMREHRENGREVFFPIIPFVSVDIRYSISRRFQGAISLGFSLDNRSVSANYYNLGASLIFKLLSYEE